jgi:plastocyanin
MTRPSPRRHRRILPLAAAIVATTLGAAACGGSAQPAASHAHRSSATRSSTAAASKAPAGAVTVTIQNFAYHAPTITVKAGMKVTWTNRDTTNHTVTADNGKFDLGNIDPGHSKAMMFTKPGTYHYHCTYHPFMHGTVVVTP